MILTALWVATSLRKHRELHIGESSDVGETAYGSDMFMQAAPAIGQSPGAPAVPV